MTLHFFRNIRNFSILSLTCAILLIGCGQEFGSGTSSAEQEFYSLYNLLDAYYLYADSELQPASSYQFSISALMEDIQDPYTDYYNPEQAKILLANLTTPEVIKLMGIQTQLVEKDSLAYLVIYRTFRESPALKAGILPKDTLLEINGKILSKQADTLSNQFNTLVEPDTVSLKLKRGDSTLSVTVVKEEIVVPTVFVDSLESNISLIQITSFTDYTFYTQDKPNPLDPNRYGTYDEFMDALEQTKSNQTTLIDLRGNPGGSISQCANIASEFLDQGDTIIVIEDHTDNRQNDGTFNHYYPAKTKGVAFERQFVLLADEGSASCAEIMISAIKSNRDIPLVGKTTYGKGIGQSFHYTLNSGIAKITSLGIYDKTLYSYHKLGLVPDFEIDGFDAQLAKAIELASPSISNRHNSKALFNQLFGYEVKAILGDTIKAKVEGAFQFEP